ncbi:hypothetical protein F5Y13DRAFT_133854 [Hypoxylon sp. FL1857]|nr:hypothetical protein F5Y13DRAFT_133854 [Hypoxylon sp. FL1857]
MIWLYATVDFLLCLRVVCCWGRVPMTSQSWEQSLIQVIDRSSVLRRPYPNGESRLVSFDYSTMQNASRVENYQYFREQKSPRCARSLQQTQSAYSPRRFLFQRSPIIRTALAQVGGIISTVIQNNCTLVSSANKGEV